MKVQWRKIESVSENLYLQIASAVLVAVLFGIFVRKTVFSLDVWWPDATALIFTGLFAFAAFLLLSVRRYDLIQLLAVMACLCCALYARVALLPFESGDYEVYLRVWVEQLGSMSMAEALRTPIGNYNLPYIYYLTILSRFGVEKLLHIKAFSCFFDVVLAFAVLKFTQLGVNDRRLELGAFLLIMLSPTIMIDSAMWAQCDAVYVAFCVIAAYAAVKGKGRLCAISWTVAFCFKLQAVFLLPALAVSLFMGKVKIKHLLWIPVVYFISLIPALAAGRSLADCVGIYVNQIDSYTGLFINAPTVWNLFGNVQIKPLTNMATWLAIGGLLLFTLCCLSVSGKMGDRQLVTLFFLSSMLTPYLLPRMHERYFYMAEVFALIYFLYDRKKWYLPVALTASSLSCYMEYFLLYSMSSHEEYLAKTTGLKPVYFAVVFLVILACEGHAFFKGLWGSTRDKTFQ